MILTINNAKNYAFTIIIVIIIVTVIIVFRDIFHRFW